MNIISFNDKNLTVRNNIITIYIDNFENKCEFKFTYTNIFDGVNLYVEKISSSNLIYEFDSTQLNSGQSREIKIKLKKPKVVYQDASLSIYFEELGALNYG